MVSRPSFFALFDTPIGACGIAWRDAGILVLQLPEADERATIRRLQAQAPGAEERRPPASVARAIAAIRALLVDGKRDLADLPLDMTALPPFHRRVYEAARKIPPGRTMSYGEIARQLGEPRAARAVGQALGRNPFALIVPCHRVLASGGKLGGFSAEGGRATKRRLLAIEGVAEAEEQDSLFAPR